MKVILQKDVKNLGKKVKLLMLRRLCPQLSPAASLAVEATAGNLKQASLRIRLKSKAERELKEAQDITAKLMGRNYRSQPKLENPVVFGPPPTGHC